MRLQHNAICPAIDTNIPRHSIIHSFRLRCWLPVDLLRTYFSSLFLHGFKSLCAQDTKFLFCPPYHLVCESYSNPIRVQSSLVFFQFANKRLSSFFVHYRALQLGRCRNATLNWHFASGFLEVLAAADIIFSFTLISPNSAVTTLRPPLAYLIIKCHFNNRYNTSGLP